MSIRALTPDDFAWVLALNAQNEVETSSLDETKLGRMVNQAFAALAYGDAGFLIAFDQDGEYSSQHFSWFRVWFPKLVYVDRVVVDAGSRGHGIGRALYQHVIDAARAAGHDKIGCEINIIPPNPGSDLFHAKMGFEEIGQSVSGKAVRYMMRRWSA